MKNETSRPKHHVAKHNPLLLTGATMDKYPIMMDDGKTIIFISDLSKENETRQKYILHRQQSAAK